MTHDDTQELETNRTSTDRWRTFGAAAETATNALAELDAALTVMLETYARARSAASLAQQRYPGDPLMFPVALTPRSIERFVLLALASSAHDEETAGRSVPLERLADTARRSLRELT
jgi:hypothetical protein